MAGFMRGFLIYRYMEKRFWMRAKTVVKGWRMGDYLRQLSIVVVGIVISFWGSDLITDHVHQKEVRSTMQLVIEELRRNRDELKMYKQCITVDIRFSCLLTKCNLDLDKIPQDTLVRYDGFSSNLFSLSNRTDALDVMKGSSLMQYIPDKLLLQNVLQVYYDLKELTANTDIYYKYKQNLIMVPALNAAPDEKGKAFVDWNVRDRLSYLLRQQGVNNFVCAIEYMMNWNMIDVLIVEMEELIGALEKKYR